MAKYWKTKYHEDITEKRDLTKDDIEFLLAIQKEMNTQDHVSQASPRYWTIRDYKHIYGDSLINPDGICIYDSDACETLYEGPYSELDEEILNELKKSLKDTVIDTEELYEIIDNSTDMSDLIDYMENLGFACMEYEEYPIDNGMFFTHEAAINHLKNNEHHYSNNAHTYAHTAISTKEKPLWNILETINWSKYI